MFWRGKQDSMNDEKMQDNSDAKKKKKKRTMASNYIKMVMSLMFQILTGQSARDETTSKL